MFITAVYAALVAGIGPLVGNRHSVLLAALAAAVVAGSGLRNMADRLAALGGRLEVQSVPTRGTTITGQLPPGSSPAPMIRP